jgi:hypothetical protein
MINLSKIYTQKQNATRDIRKAVERGECKAGEYEVRESDGGYQIVTRAFVIAAAQAKAEMRTDFDRAMGDPNCEGFSGVATVGATTTTAEHMAVLNALLGAKVISDRPVSERAGVWMIFSSIYDSSNPTTISKKSMGGISRALSNRGYIKIDTGLDVNGKYGPIVQLTSAGIEALRVG